MHLRLSILYCIQHLKEPMPLMCMIQMCEVVLSGILSPLLLSRVVLRILPNCCQVAYFAQNRQSFMPSLLLIGSKDIFFGRTLLILAQILIEFQVEERVALLPVSHNQSTQSLKSFSKPIIFCSED